jgi:predicted transport protein
VREEFLKIYVAYKAETNFADVVPQASSLRITLNRDVSGLGRWGNGDVEAKVENLEDIAYVVGLARQVLELQIGDGESPTPEYTSGQV